MEIASKEITHDQFARVRAWHLPEFRQMFAKKNGVEKKIAFVTYGGLGDVLCAEPTIRYMAEVLRESLGIESIHVVTRFPQIFAHIPHVEPIVTPPTGLLDLDVEEYHFLYCGLPEGDLQHSFFTHNNMLPVDYPALSALRTQLPLSHRFIVQKLSDTHGVEVTPAHVVIHAGNHWESKTFPEDYWNEIMDALAYVGLVPILIGGAPNGDPGTVDINSSGCLDLREKLTVAQSADILSKAKVVITNDSFPLHLATIGGAHIGFFATAKDPEWLMHWRQSDLSKIEFGWRMKNLAHGGAYQRTFTPQAGGNHLSTATPEELQKWLPRVSDILVWLREIGAYGG